MDIESILPSLLMVGHHYYFANPESAYEYMGKTGAGFHVFSGDIAVQFDERDLAGLPLHHVHGPRVTAHKYEAMGISIFDETKIRGF